MKQEFPKETRRPAALAWQAREGARALIALALLAAPAAAHEAFPPEWCGGADCRFAAAGEVAIEGDSYLVRLDGAEIRVPLSAAPLWQGCRIALCVHADGGRLNRCNPARGDCPPQSEFGLLIPAWHVFPEMGEDCAEAEAGAAQALSHAGLASPRPVSPAPRGGLVPAPGGGGAAGFVPPRHDRGGGVGVGGGGGAVAPVPLSPSIGFFGAALAALLIIGIRRRA